MTSGDQQYITIDVTEAKKPQPPKIFADIASSFTYASYQNAIPVLRRIGVDNQSDRQIEALRLELSSTPAFLRSKTWTIDRVIPGDHLLLGDRKVELDVDETRQAFRLAYARWCCRRFWMPIRC